MEQEKTEKQGHFWECIVDNWRAISLILARALFVAIFRFIILTDFWDVIYS